VLFRRYQLFPETEEMLIEKVRQRTFLYDTKLPDYRDQHMRANVWEGIGKELKTKRKFFVSSRDVRIVCPRLRCPTASDTRADVRCTRLSSSHITPCSHAHECILHSSLVLACCIFGERELPHGHLSVSCRLPVKTIRVKEFATICLFIKSKLVSSTI
jgi:hypothetical protein